MKRTVEPLKKAFQFKKFELDTVPAQVFSPDYDDSDWRTVRVPHDWGIEGEFSAENDPTETIVKEDGMVKSTLMTGWNGGLPTVGAGVYRKWVTIEPADKVFLELDGVMWTSKVYCNGVEVGGCHFGYKSYEVDLTPAVKFGEKNLLAIYAEVRPNAGRWYTGAGLYRNLRLVRKDKEHITYNGVWVRQTYADKTTAVMDITIDTVGTQGFTATITDPYGREISYTSDDNSLIFKIQDPALWDVDAPHLYTATVTLASGDSQQVNFGVRICEFTTEGFFLNGRKLKMNGVCMHHDLGSIGAAVNISALRRQIEIMQGMGVNAWRTSHNPPAPELLDLCDEMGILVMDELYDEWTDPKVKHGYTPHFAEHAKEDAIDVVRRDRNHPCVIMWSSGNEVRDQKDPNGWKPAKLLYDAIRATDPTRPVTCAFNFANESFENHLAFYTDIVGLNYKPHEYKKFHQQYPHIQLVGSETESCVSTRGIYHFPAKINIGKPKNEDLAVSAYELCAPGWAYYPERELAAQEDCPFVMGEFIWTGFDYIGEPTPYYTEWPSRSSYFGVVDLAGLPKNRYYCYRAHWTNTPTLHIFPHWTWPGKEGENVPVHIYTNYEEVELFVNGVSQGKRRHATAADVAGIYEKRAEKGVHLGRFRLMWNDVVYQPGEITAIAYQNGLEVARSTVKTAGEPHHIKLSAYSKKIHADGEDLNFITASILDAEGNLCPHAADRLTFTVEGAAEFLTTDAGDQRETETFLRPDKKALAGMLVCCVRATEQPGAVTVTCSGEGLLPGTVTFEAE